MPEVRCGWYGLLPLNFTTDAYAITLSFVSQAVRVYAVNPSADLALGILCDLCGVKAEHPIALVPSQLARKKGSRSQSGKLADALSVVLLVVV